MSRGDDVSLNADDLWPLVQKLPREEQLRLARRALASPGSADAAAYERQPVREGEFNTDDDAMAWESEGWDSPP
jgi:hypothetical protein